MDNDIFSAPIRLIPNRFYRGYPGGREIDRFRNLPDPEDDMRPEAWVGSVTAVHNGQLDEHGKPLGMAEAVFDGKTIFVKDLLDAHPVEMLGREHATRFGGHPQVLVKLLDAQKQLMLQCHPTREFAKQAFGSPFGKTECWYVIGLREDGPEPYVILGFRERANRSEFEKAYVSGDIAALEAMCHKIPVQPGEMYFVDAGVPHAVGPGCFVVEVQEPSDITVGVSRSWNHSDDPAEQEFLDNRLLDSYIYDGCGLDGMLKRYRIPPMQIKKTSGGLEEVLIGKKQTPWFSANRIQVLPGSRFSPAGACRLGIVIVTKGCGKIVTPQGELETKKGDEWLFPASMAEYELKAGNEGLEFVVSYPPEVE